MTVQELLSNYAQQNIVSETEVRTKLAIPLLTLLGYPDSHRAEEFPVYGYDGRKQLNPKFADIMCFEISDFNDHRTRDERNWVKEHSLLTIELKKPAEAMESEGQAEFYAMWARTPYYLITNGVELALYTVEQFTEDRLLIRCNVQSLPENWDTLKAYIQWGVIQGSKTKRSSNVPENLYDEYVQASLVRINGELRLTLSRTMSRETTYRMTNFTITLSAQLNNDVEKLTYEELLVNEGSMVILSEPGGGKSHLLRMMTRDLLLKVLGDRTGRIPVILQARLWERSYKSVVEGIQKELNPYCPALSYSQIEDDLKNLKFVVFVDGLDELTTDAETLYDQLLSLSRSGAQIIATCRARNYHLELRETFRSFTLDPLTDDQIQEYATEVLGETGVHFSYRLGTQLTNLVRNPLFLFMTTQVIRSSSNYQLPANKADLYGIYMKFLLRDWNALKGIRQVHQTDYTIIQRILANYAQCTFREASHDGVFVDAISSYLGWDAVAAVREQILDSGLLVEGQHGPDFYHPTFHEYFVAVFYSYQSEDTLMRFVVENHNDESYTEVFLFLSGLLTDDSRQSILLDYLEENNLPLFRRCLGSRFDRTELLTKTWSNDFVRQYLSSVRSSYLRIIESHFSVLRSNFHPWMSHLPGDEAQHMQVIIKGSLNPSVPALSYQYLLTSSESSNQLVVAEEFRGTPTIKLVSQTDAPTITPISMTMGDGHMFHDLRQSHMGLDSAREVAFFSIKKQLKSMLDNRITFFAESNAMGCEYIESELRKMVANPFMPIPEDLIGLSLYDRTFEHVVERIQKYSNLSGFEYSNGMQRKINFPLMMYYLLRMKEEGVSPGDFLLPGPDKTWEEVPQDERNQFAIWSDDRLELRIQKFYDHFQSSYRGFVEQCFPTLKGHLYLYHVGPVRYYATVYKPRESSDLFRAHVVLTWEPVSEGDSTETVVRISDSKPSKGWDDQEFERIRQQLRNLGRNSDRITTGGGGLLSMYLGNDSALRKQVYDTLIKDLTDSLGNL